jgi:hypothetical protein
LPSEIESIFRPARRGIKKSAFKGKLIPPEKERYFYDLIVFRGSFSAGTKIRVYQGKNVGGCWFLTYKPEIWITILRSFRILLPGRNNV